MKVNEIFLSIDGEVNFSGQGAFSTFIRFAGCNLACSYCDTPDTQDSKNGTEMEVSEIIRKVKEIGCPKVTITGGEPLLQKDFEILLANLVTQGFRASIETNGTTLHRLIGVHPAKVNWIVDYKLEYSDKMNLEIFERLNESDYIKVPIKNLSDLEKAIHFKESLGNKVRCRFAVSPIGRSISVLEIMDRLSRTKDFGIQINQQLHKLIGLK